MDAVQRETDKLIALAIVLGFAGGVAWYLLLAGSLYVGVIFVVLFLLATISLVGRMQELERAWREQ